MSPSRACFTICMIFIHNISHQTYPHNNITLYILDYSDNKDLSFSEIIKSIKQSLGNIKLKYRKIEKTNIGKVRNTLVKCVEESIICHMDVNCFYDKDYINDSVNKLNENNQKIVICNKYRTLFIDDDFDSWKITNAWK